MMRYTLMIGAVLVLALGCSAPDDSEVDQRQDVGDVDLGSDMAADMLPSPEVCEAIVMQPGERESFQEACAAAGCIWDIAFPTFEKGGECRYRWEDSTHRCFAPAIVDPTGDTFPGSYVNDRTGEVLVINSLYYDRIIGWTQCQPDEAPSLPADHFCRTCKEISDP